MLDDAVRTELPADLTGPAMARRCVAEHAGDLPVEVVHDAQLLVSELVTNAVRYGAPPIVVRVQAKGGELRIAVDDHGSAMPKVIDPPSGPNQPSGRGLSIVAAIAREWGVIPSGSGKRVWFMVGGS